MSDSLKDPVVAEVHAARTQMLAKAGGDIKEMMRQVAGRQRESTHQTVAAPFRKRADNQEQANGSTPQGSA